MVEISPPHQPHFEQTPQATLVLKDYPVKLVDASGKGSIVEILKEMFGSLHLYRLVSYAINNSALAEPLREIGVVDPIPTHGTSKNIKDDQRPRAAAVCRGCVLQNLSQAYYLASLPEQEELAFLMLEETLRRLKVDAATANVKLIILLIPTKLEVETETDEELFLDTAGILGLGTGEVISINKRLHNKILDLCQQLDIKTLDLLPQMTTFHRQHKESLFYSNDWHLSPVGHRVVAMEVHRILNEEHIWDANAEIFW